MNLSQLPSINLRKAKRVGRGLGSGKGSHTSGRGNKGQKARGSVPQLFEGTKAKKSFVKRLPLLRGRGKFKRWGIKRVALPLEKFNEWTDKLAVTEENLIKNGWLRAGAGAKIVNKGEIKKALEIRIPVSKSVREKIEAAGGKIA